MRKPCEERLCHLDAHEQVGVEWACTVRVISVHGSMCCSVFVALSHTVQNAVASS